MFYSIHYIRGIAALLVVFFHFREELNNVYPFKKLGDVLFINGYIGVDLFFIISGFVIALSTKNDASIKTFVLKRVLRIYPVYFLCMLLVIGVWKLPLDISTLKAFMFIPLDFSKPAPWYGYSIIITAWTLTYEIVFYLVFALSMLISWRHRILLSSFIIVLFNTSLQLIFMGKVTLNPYSIIMLPENYAWLTIYFLKTLSSPIMLEFILGCLLYSVLESGWITRKINGFLVKITFTCSFIGVVLYYILSTDGAHGVLGAGVYSFCVIGAAIIYEQKFKLRNIGLFVWLGNISYSLYLIHPIVIKSFAGKFLTFQLYSSSHGVINFVFLVTLSLLCATVLYYVVEKPSMSYARKLLFTKA